MQSSRNDDKANRMKLALGTVQFGLPYGIANQTGQVSETEAGAILALARSAGMDTLDTAIGYGESEARLGECGVSDFRVVSKLPSLPDDIFDIAVWVEKQVAASLERSRVPKLYGLLLHRSENLLGPRGKALYAALVALQEKGWVDKIGVSIYAPAELESAFAVASLQLIQAPLNILDRRLRESGWLEKLRQRQVEVHARSVFLQGLLLMPHEGIPRKFAPWASIFDHWFAVQYETQRNAAQICLDYVSSLPEVDRIVIGVDNRAQLQMLLACMAHVQKLPETTLAKLACNDENLINPSLWNTL